ncbi:hypothetical protein Pmar_PMAR009967 [Perkinsus marinus ATCC 50983]|uniref:Pyruvate kinase C-terminal domain-containing protein n=1 Tax=Perkinsus marinus (strain ATCC 50983 / TXsc) TaxID=423536 RepID=C5L2R0_PERM5|nr:hypothetical protein Pmar_PMAR009967 [Perkinsus marinus ATCC 50983]EER08975.1 hypothetical protein Pmar_PMAR009967 [Perkinsus marinus ATCC 50983]|eukprot:XP_002777159.1 hypothetical protein Pmar_PMAR009967 [Perkinsus marinus ATCC 50983]
MAIDSKVEEEILTMVGVADKRVRAMDESAAEACFNSAPTPRLRGKDMPYMKVAASVNLATIPEENLTEEYFGRLLGGGASIVVLDITKGVFSEAGITQVGKSAVIIPPVRTGAEITSSRSSALGRKRRRIKIFSICARANLAGKLLSSDQASHAAATIHTLEDQVSAADAFSSSPSKSDSVVRLVVERAIAIQRDPGNEAKLIVAFSDDGTTAAMLSRMRPSCKILAMSASEAVVNFFTTLWGVEPLQTSSYQSAEAVIQNVKDFCKDTGLAASGTNLVVVRPIPSTATLEEIDDLDAFVELVEV